MAGYLLGARLVVGFGCCVLCIVYVIYIYEYLNVGIYIYIYTPHIYTHTTQTTGLGDRHPSNLMLERASGRVVHIDFGDCFEVRACNCCRGTD